MNADEMLVLACSQGRLAEVRRLVEEFGANPSGRTNQGGFTPLMVASASLDTSRNSVKNGLEVVRYLLDKGADVNAVSSRGTTAPTIARSTGQFDVAMELVSHPSMIFEKIPKYNTPAFRNFVQRPESRMSQEEFDELNEVVRELSDSFDMLGGRGDRPRSSSKKKSRKRRRRLT
jgi:hypothetical protein